MKPRDIMTGRLFVILLAISLPLLLISWDYQPTPGQFEQSITDTTPKQNTYDRNKKVRNLDEVLEELDAADRNINMELIKKELAAAMKNWDQEKIKLDIEKAMKDIDLAKIQKEVQASLAKVDFSKIKEELALAMKNIDMASIQKEVKESLAKIDFDNMRAALEKVKEIDFKKLQDEMKELGPKMEIEMKKAKLEMEKAKTEIKAYETFVNNLESDGLINKKEGFTLKHKDGDFYINGKKASQKIKTKYKDFLERHKQFDIKITDADFKLKID